jgi:hypothetical protein
MPGVRGSEAAKERCGLALRLGQRAVQRNEYEAWTG